MIFEADEVFVLYNVVCFIFGKCTENIFTIVFESRKQIKYSKRKEKKVNLCYGLIWPGHYISIQSSQLHKLNILSETAWTVCVYVYTCVCLCLTFCCGLSALDLFGLLPFCGSSFYIYQKYEANQITKIIILLLLPSTRKELLLKNI